jgi:peptidyl-prolyl cis-trans isomerase C
MIAALPAQAQEEQTQEEQAKAATYDPNLVLAYQSGAVLTQAAIDAAFTNVPEKDRLVFIRDGAQVDRVVTNLLRTQILANDARKNGWDENPLARERIQQAIDQELASMWLEQIALSAEPADYEALAHERYLANPNQYKSEEMIDVSHVLVGTKERSPDEALALAEDLRQRLLDNPDQFDAIVKEFSDDPAKDQNIGRYPIMRRGQMVAPFEEAAFALTTPGQLSELVETPYGYHIIRLNRIYERKLQDYSEVKASIIAQVTAEHQNRYKARYLQTLLTEPVQFPPGSIEIMAKRHFGEDLEMAPDYYQADQ